MSHIIKRISLCWLLLATLTTLFAQSAAPGTFEAGKNSFILNGKPFVVRAAELHYPRIPKAYWEHRIQLCKAMGMNTICIYLFWNYHEQQEGVFDFEGQKDVAAFVKLVQKNGMYCIVRPGPYVCAEWDMGGLPWWLLKKKDLQVRSVKDSLFMQKATRYLKQAGKQLAPLQIQNGGNIIMVQVENEYGVWGNDEVYMSAIRDQVRAAGFDKVQLFRCDWSSNFHRYKLEGVASTLNFGAGSNIDNQFKKFKEMNPDAPLMCSEYWTGWFDQWGRPHETRDINSFIGSLKDMMDRNISFSLYMAHGGTSFGQWAGANAPPYAPTASSYDYNAPIDEAGNTTDKFFAVRNLLKNYLQEGEVLGDIPENPEKTIAIPAMRFTQTAGLFANLPVANTSVDIASMEQFNQGWGRILYRTQLPAGNAARKLYISEVHDWATVFVNGKAVGKLDRRRGDNSVNLPATNAVARLDILVEATGRVNYGQAIIDRKGITQKVVLVQNADSTVLHNWQVYNFPVDYAFQQQAKYAKSPANGPAWYKTSFILTTTGNTFLDMSQWGKGMVWVNGYNLGRFWKIGPQQTLYCPGSWLKKGINEIIVLDVDRPAAGAVVAGLEKPILNKTSQDESLLHRKPGQMLQLQNNKPVITGNFAAGNGWKTVTFDAVKQGRYFCLEAISAQNENDPVASVAEIELLAEDGSVLSTLPWKVLYADSEEVTAANNAADKLYDAQESLIWQTQTTGNKPRHPHQVVIDLGSVVKVKGFRILPRSDKSTAGIIKDYKFYLEEKPFAL
ncbi:beta-galactosidase [Filimonas lacunae]|uniref:Beta-galactosidase n=1 Tax=Filimonas lacunae TaxID=477680 RepID=A0A173MAA9_9BACT|nr:beta-galactosidase [Filimonas lacunae]BAV04494.1 beta-galactosidase [Filimonas lacunae]SIT31578.1 beta-galactosidase [Filimonas lacunae]